MKYNIQTMMKLRSAWHTFRDNHPNLPPFLKEVLKKGIQEDVQFEIIAHYPDGSELKSGIRVRQSDVELFEALQNMM